MRKLYIKIYNILKQVDFNAIWKGFHLFPYALYDGETVFFETYEIPYDDRFLGNTSIKYNNEYVAIWNVPDPNKENTEDLASNIVHEMFHAFQNENNETRYPQDLIMLNYPNNVRNYELKYAENLILSDAFMETDLNKKRELLAQFISIRRSRKNLIGDMIDCELLAETVEGMAEYAGIMALKQISLSKYKERIILYLNYLKELSNMLFDIRRISYFIGLIFYTTVTDIGLSLYHDIGNCKENAFDVISTYFDSKVEVNIPQNKEVEEKLKKYIFYKNREFDEFFNTNHEKVNMNSTICGYDPMNMVKIKDYILCKHFVILWNNQNNEQKFIKGPVMLEMEKDSCNQVVSYYL